MSAVLTLIIGVLSVAFGSYIGYVTLRMNYITIGTMQARVGGLLVVAGFFIFFGAFGCIIAIKEFFIASRNEEKFSAYKPSLISAVVYYSIVSLISVAGLISAIVAYIPSVFTWTIIGLSVLTLGICIGTFYLVFKELKEHKKALFKKSEENKKIETEKKEQNNNDYAFVNMQLTAEEIHKFLNATKKQEENKDKNEEVKEDRKDIKKGEVDLYSLAEKLMQLEELKKSGLINDGEYQFLKKQIF